MSSLSPNTLELNRTFLKVPDNDAGLSPEATLHAALLFNQIETWEELLEHPYVVVLGEAGTGKSTEFRLQAQSKADQGEFSFFVELLDLAMDGLEHSLDLDDDLRLEEWRKGEEDAIFFLDSLDEAKLRDRTLHHALRNLYRELRTQWNRVRLVVSCRASDWMAEGDRNELMTVAPDKNREVHIVQLAPLNPSQVGLLAKAAGVTDVAAFMEAVTDNHAQAFVERPLDVQWLGTYWERYKNIGCLQTLIEDNIREKLSERPGRTTHLARTKAEEGVQTLAGIASINNTWTFALPENALDAHRTREAIEPQKFLPDWSQVDIAELLRRPLFDEATYGRVRLHHRSVQEFLAAKWVHDLILNGMTHARVRELFFYEENGEHAIPDHLGPIAAWLALWDEQLRVLLIQEAPALLIGNGDPSGFSDEERRQILRSYAKSYEGIERQFERFDYASFQRFSAPTLSKEIRELLETSDTPDELVSVLVQIVEHGRISTCVDICLDLALDLSRSSRVRASAIRAVASVGAEPHHSVLLGLLDSTPNWDHSIAGAFIRALYPEQLDPRGLTRLLGDTTPTRRNHTTSLDVVLEYELHKIGSLELRLELLDQLLQMVWVLDENTDSHIVSFSQNWLLPAIAQIVTAVLDELPNGTEITNVIERALTVFRWCNENEPHIWDGLDEVKRVITRHPEIKRFLFWRQVEEYQRREGSTPTRYSELMSFDQLYKLDSSDRTWLADDARNYPEVQGRLLAFDALSTTPDPGGNPACHLEFLGEVADGISELTTRLDRMRRRPSLSQVLPQVRQWELKRRARELKQARKEALTRNWLERNIDQIREGTHFDALWFLYQNAGGNHIRYSDRNADSLKERYGVQLAEAAVAGWRAFWRTYEPQMPHEREQRNSIPLQVIIGLVGINLDFAGDLDATQLDREEAKLAVRYASCELNSFPVWLDTLIDVYPDVVTATLCPSAIADMTHADDGTSINDVLAKLARADEGLKTLLAPCIAEQLREEEPPMVTTLAHALRIVAGGDTTMLEDFTEFACSRCHEAIEDEKRFATWWEAFFFVDSSRALDLLETVVGESSPDRAYQLVLHVCLQIHTHSEPYGARSLAAQQQPEVLRRLLTLVYDQIREDDDIEHESGHTFGPRDYAQEVRVSLLSRLEEIPGMATVQSLRELAEDPRFVANRDWLLHRARQRLVADAGLVACSSDLVQQLTELFSTRGTTAVAHLGELSEEEHMKPFDVGIVTMKEEEFSAVLDRFDALATFQGEKRSYQATSVETPQGGCRIAITRCLKQGNIFAQTVVHEMITDLDPRFLLVVGIAGGIPTTDFCLGDVVISNEIMDLTYEDTGSKPGEERYDASSYQLHPSVSQVVENLLGVERSTPDWNSEDSINCVRPNLDGQHTTGDEEWNALIDQAIQVHLERDKPIGTARKIAASDRLIKNPDFLQKWHPVLKTLVAVEMESAGASLACHRSGVPFLAIRGISDIVGWKRDEKWTLYACHTAAAYTKMLIDAGVFVEK